MTKELIPQNITAVQLFSENGLDPLLNRIKSEIDKFVPNVETEKGRKEIASFARKIASSKVLIEKVGKELVSEIKAKAKLIDAERKRSRDTLDQWRDEVRQPLTEYEEAEKLEHEKRRLQELFNLEHADAIAENSIFDRERDLKKKEAEIERVLEENRKKEEAERTKKEREEIEIRIKEEAEQKAKADAEMRIKEEKERSMREAAQAKEELEQARRAKIEAEEKAERDRIAAKEKAEQEKQQAIEQIKRDAEEKIRIENETKAKEKEIADKKASNKRHMATVNNKIVSSLKKLGLEESIAKDIVIAVAKGNVPRMEIRY